MDKIPFIEGILNTPSAHRVHHGSNAIYIDKTYGGILMLWDRFFGTYEAETEKVEYGVTTGFQGHNPLKAQFQPLFDYLRGTFKREKYNVGQPEEKLSDSPNTAYVSPELQGLKPEMSGSKA